MAKKSARISLEGLFTSREGFGVTTATPLQRAICRIVDGEPLGDLARHPHVIGALGTDTIPFRGPPFEIIILAAIRGGKSKFAACLSTRNALTCDLSKVTSGDEVRSSIVSVKLDLASPILSHIKGGVMGSKALRPLVVGEPTQDGLDLLHPSKRKVEIRITSGSKAGSSLVARYSAGCVFDEAARMQGQEDGVVNLDHLKEAVIGRFVDGAQLIEISSPWAPMGPIYDAYTEHWGKPTQDLVVLKARGDWMNPIFWTPKRIEDLRRRNPRAYKTDFLAEFADLESALFPAEIVERSSRGQLVLPPDPMQEYVAAMDPATRKNAWTLCICTRKGGKKIVVLAKQYMPQPGELTVNTREVLRDVASICRQYRIDVVKTDQLAPDFVRDIASEFGLSVSAMHWTQENKAKLFDEMEKQFAMGLVEIPSDPYLKQDLIGTKRVVTGGGAVKIVFPRTKDGRHGDYAPCLAMALKQYLEEPLPAGPERGTKEWIDAQVAKEKAEHIARVKAAAERRESEPWWTGVDF